MDIASKYKIVEKIIQTDDDYLLNEIKSLVGLSENDFWKDTPLDVKQAINQAKDELDRGEGISHSEVMTYCVDTNKKKSKTFEGWTNPSIRTRISKVLLAISG